MICAVIFCSRNVNYVHPINDWDKLRFGKRYGNCRLLSKIICHRSQIEHLNIKFNFCLRKRRDLLLVFENTDQNRFLMCAFKNCSILLTKQNISPSYLPKRNIMNWLYSGPDPGKKSEHNFHKKIQKVCSRYFSLVKI